MTTRNLLLSLLCAATLLPATASAQTITTVAGNGGSGNTGDGGPATSAQVGTPYSVAVAPGGGFYVGGDSIVRFVSAEGIIRTVAGDGTPGNTGDGGPAIAARLSGPVTGLAVAADGTLHIGDRANLRVRRVGSDGVIHTAAVLASQPISMAIDLNDNVYIGGSCRVDRLSPSGALERFAGTGTCGTPDGWGVPATAAVFGGDITALAVDHAGNVLLKDAGEPQVKEVRPDGTIGAAMYVFAGNEPVLAADDAGNLYVANPPGYISTRTGAHGIAYLVTSGYSAGFAGDGGPASAASVNHPRGLAVDVGRLLIADTFNHRIRSINLDIRPVGSAPPTSCASEGYTGTKLKWCQNICESELSPAQIETWIHRWIDRYRGLPYCAVEDEEEPELPPQA